MWYTANKISVSNVLAIVHKKQKQNNNKKWKAVIVKLNWS